MPHAPGPWAICETETRISIKSGKRTVAYVQMARNDSENAKLIASAPKMLAALKLARIILEDVIHPKERRSGDGLHEISTAIAEAEGT